MLFLDLFHYQLSNRQTIGMFIVKTFLRPDDWRSLYNSSHFFNSQLQEKCPMCKTPLEPKKKLDFLRETNRRMFYLPRPPCGTKTCSRNHQIFGYFKNRGYRNKRYSLCIFTKNFDPKRVSRWLELTKDNRQDEYDFEKAYRRSGYSIQMSRMSFWLFRPRLYNRRSHLHRFLQQFIIFRI